MVDQPDGADEKQSIVPWPQSIPELEGLGTSSNHPGPSHTSPPALPWQLPSGHSSCRFLRSLPLLALFTESSLYGAELCSRSRKKSEPVAPPSLLSSSSCSLIASPTYRSRQSLLVWGSSEPARQQGPEETPLSSSSQESPL